ncbi:molybdopterin-dependent oxidoreductase [Paracoccaceae bacterium]
MICATALYAQDAASGQKEVLLTVSGEIDAAGAEALTFDREALMAMPATTIETSTIWTDGVHSFTGVALSDLTGPLGVDGGTLLATAINDYTVEIPVTDAVAGGPIIAYLMDGAEMSVRDKGPLWIIYPYDSSAEYRSEVIYARSIWQLDRIEVKR